MLSVFTPGNEPTKMTVVLFDEGSSLWLHLYVIEPPRLGATIGQATIHQLVGIQSQEVNEINADETEGQLEGIHILLLPSHRVREEGAKNLNRHGSLFGRLGFHLEGAERIPSGHTIVDGIIEDSPNIPQMDGASIHGRTPTSLRTQPSLEAREPILRYHLEGERLSVRIESQNLFYGDLVDFTSPLGLAEGGIGTEASQEQIISTCIRTQLGSHTILHLDSRQADQITSVCQFQDDFRNTSHRLQQEEVCRFIRHRTTHLLCLCIPLRRQDTNTNGKLGVLVFMGEVELQGSRTAIGNTTDIEIIMDFNHFSRIDLHEFCTNFATKQHKRG